MNSFKIKIGHQELSADLNKFAEQANGSAFVRYGDTVLLATATMATKKENINFFPLIVDYEEKFYAAGKIGGSRYTRREGKPSDLAVTTSRLIDRTLRPAFSNDFVGTEVQIVNTCLSWDGENDPDVVGIVASSMALMVSDIDFNSPIGAVRIGLIENEIVINPTYEERKKSDINVIFSGLKNEKQEVIINMIEGDFKETKEKIIVRAFNEAQKAIKEICEFQEIVAKEIGKTKIVNDKKEETDNDFASKLKSLIKDQLSVTLNQKNKKETTEEKNKLQKKIEDWIKNNYDDFDLKINLANDIVEQETDNLIKENILLHNKRCDGRKLDELRKLDISVGILPRTHGSAIFGRGETKSLSILTLGAPGDNQLLEALGSMDEKRYMHHYNFPPYSVGEVKPLRGPSRRDIGHGTLAEKALTPVLPEIEKFPYAIRVVSEILSSNGSTSMAATCSSSMALMDAGVPIKRPVAGISIGIIQGENSEYKLLTDIQGLEDHHGGMDLKIAGTTEGVTAIQMDVKIQGINQKIFEESLEAAQKTRLEIIKEMTLVLEKPREELSKYAPRIISFKINTDKIREVIGPGGKTINEIIDATGATIDIEDSGTVFVTAEKEESAAKAVEWIKNITREVVVGELFEGTVKRIMDFGAFVEILPGQEGLIHISKLSKERVNRVEDVVKNGDKVSVKVIEIDSQGRINLSLDKILK